MATPLEKARKDRASMKAKILFVARRIFGEYGYHGTTMRMIAHGAGIDISTLYYHWGDKSDLYEAVIMDIREDLRQRLSRVEKAIHGLPLARRMDIAIDMMTDYLFAHPEISNIILFRYFGKTRHGASVDLRVPEFVSNIALSMNLCGDVKNVPTEAKMQVLAIMNGIHNFISGENFFRPMLKLPRKAYVTMVKNTLKFIFIPAFVRGEGTAQEESEAR
jgi:AcrR family transcriptional regulator